MPKERLNIKEVDKKRLSSLNEKLDAAMSAEQWDAAQKIAALIKTLEGEALAPAKTKKPKQPKAETEQEFDVGAITTSKQKIKNKIQECANGSSSGTTKSKEVIFIGTAPSQKESKLWKKVSAYRENIPRAEVFKQKIICQVCKTELTERNRTKTIFDETSTKVYRCHKCKHDNNI